MTFSLTHLEIMILVGCPLSIEKQVNDKLVLWRKAFLSKWVEKLGYRNKKVVELCSSDDVVGVVLEKNNSALER